MQKDNFESKHFFLRKMFANHFFKNVMFLSTVSLSMGLCAQNIDNNLSNEALINQYVLSKGGSIIVFDSSNIKQFWIDNSVMSKNNNINILLNEKNESRPLKIQLANVKGTQDCTIEVLSETQNVAFSVLDNNSEQLVSSTEKDSFLQYNVIESSPVHLDETADYSFFLKFQSAEKNELAIKRIILSFSSNKNYLASPGEIILSENFVMTKKYKGEISSHNDKPNSFFATGQNTEVLSNKKILVSDNTISISVKIRNTGETTTTVYCGYLPYTEDNQRINNKNNPYKVNKTLSVVSSEANSNIIIVDSYPEWEKGCSLVLNAKDDLSDFPNFSFLDGTIENITKIDDTHIEIRYFDSIFMGGI